MQYVRGLDTIRQGRYPAAVEALTQAMQASPDPSFVLARGVAECLGGRLREAIADFAQAKRVGLKGREADLWTYAAQMMSRGQERSSLDHRGPGNQPWFGGAPGHIIQGRDDYPTDYASFVYYEMATPYGKLGPTPEVRGAVRQAGAWFANRAATRADLAPAHLLRAKELYGQGANAAVLDSLAFVRPVYPGSAEVNAYSGSAWLRLGRPATARRELTVGLTAATRMAGGYLNRAFAAARLGDHARARLDLDRAAAYDPALAGRDKAALEHVIAANRVDGQPADLLAALETAARSDAPVDSLVAPAAALHKAMAPRRLRYDEWYQDRLREREDAIRAAPRSAAPYVELARFLIDGRISPTAARTSSRATVRCRTAGSNRVRRSSAARCASLTRRSRSSRTTYPRRP
jgi:tetratricopeptide (TPR) repeat protein